MPGLFHSHPEFGEQPGRASAGIGRVASPYQYPVKYFRNFTVAVIGPTTKAALEGLNVRVDIIPREYTIDGLVKSIVDFYRKENH